MTVAVDERFNRAVLKDMATTSFNKKALGLEVAEPAVTPPSSDTKPPAFSKNPSWPAPNPENATFPKACGPSAKSAAT